MAASDFDLLLERPVLAREPPPPPPPPEAISTLAAQLALYPHLARGRARDVLEAICAEIDLLLTRQINAILHHAEFQALEATWRGLHFLVRNTETGPLLKIKFLVVSKRDLSRSLRKYRGTAWDRSPMFKKIYEEEYGQFGGEPFGVLMGAYEVDHRPEDLQLISDMAMIAAAAHVPFITAAGPASPLTRRSPLRPTAPVGSPGRARFRSGPGRSSCADDRRTPHSCWSRGQSPDRTGAQPVRCG